MSVSDLRGDQGEKNNDGQVIMNKISDYLSEKQLPRQKIEMIEEVLRVVFIHSSYKNQKMAKVLFIQFMQMYGRISFRF